jgi:hypothetical protein
MLDVSTQNHTLDDPGLTLAVRIAGHGSELDMSRGFDRRRIVSCQAFTRPSIRLVPGKWGKTNHYFEMAEDKISLYGFYSTILTKSSNCIRDTSLQSCQNHNCVRGTRAGLHLHCSRRITSKLSEVTCRNSRMSMVVQNI